MQKNIVICCDGTANEPGNPKNDTNVVRIFALAQKDDPKQICFYDPGVGCGNWEYDTNNAEKFADQATGEGLQKNVNDAYEFLQRTYNSGDRIYLFGFSRGAFTVRSLAGMLWKVGLLRPHLKNLLGYAAKMYNIEGNQDDAAHFKLTFSQPSCFIQFIGVWDTVESLKFKAGERNHDIGMTPETRVVYHAVAADERRGLFRPKLFCKGANIYQKWFPGGHADVGGGYPDRSLSDIALGWIAKRAYMRGMAFNDRASRELKGDPLGKIHDEFKGAWRLGGQHKRKMQHGDTIHDSLTIRQRKMKKKYRPKAIML